MGKAVYKVGQEVEMVQDFVLESCLGSKAIEVKKGDKAYFDANGFVHYTTGNARGMLQPSNSTIKGFDISNIAKMIYNHLDRQYAISDFLEGEDIESSDFTYEIESMLDDIL